MSNSVIDSMFQIADINKSNNISIDEYSSFANSFVKPYLKCAAQWSVTTDEQMGCLLKGKWAQNLF